MTMCRRFITMLSLLVSLGGSLLACASDDAGGEGTITVMAYGESFIEDGIPESEMEDGWEIVFDRFDVEITDVTVAGMALDDPGVVDLTQASDGTGHELGSVLAESGDHGGAGFTIARVEVEGTGSRDGEVKQFSWVFDEPVRYAECETTTSLADGGAAAFQITVHADHFLYDSLAHEEPALRFQALADADLDGDGEITEQELADTDIGGYDPGSGGDVNDLWTYLVAASQTLGHVDGEGHCHAHASDS